VCHFLADNHMATPAAACQALHLWSAVTAPPSTPVVTPRRHWSARILAGGNRAFNRCPPAKAPVHCRLPRWPPPSTPVPASRRRTSSSPWRPLANGHASATTPLRSGTIAACRGVLPLRLFSRDAGDVVVEPALQAPPPPPLSSPPVSPTLHRTWINVPHGSSAPLSPSLAHVVVRSLRGIDSGSPSSYALGGRDGRRGEGPASPSRERHGAPTS
jgi:hypothetical protein